MKKIGLPLLARELTEASVRRTTYIYRIVLALALSIIGLAVLVDSFISSNPFRLLGRGRELLQAVVYTEFVYIYGLLPVLASGAFTEEKERDTLSLLLLTRLGPWTIVLEKVLGRLVPTLAMIMLTMPLLAFAYSLGGVSRSDIAAAVWLQVVGSLQVITIAVMTSSYCRKTVSAYLLAWFVGLTTASIPLILDEMSVINIRLEEMTIPPALFDAMLWRPVPLHWVMVVSIPTLLICATSVGLARHFLTRCETKAQKNPFVRIFGSMDVLVREQLDRWSQGRLRLSSDRPLPDTQPIYWKETSCDVINRPQYRTYNTVLGTVVIGLATIIGAESEGGDGLAFVYFGFLSMIALAAVVKSATLISGERSRQTLDILLSTPLTSREIIRQKMAGIHRLLLTFAIPFAVMLLIDGTYRHFQQNHWFRGRQEDQFIVGLYLVGSVATVMIYLPMLSWLATLIGLRARRQIAALFLTLAAIVAWALVPMFVSIAIFEATGVRPGDDWAIFLLTSPLPFLALQEVVELNRLFPSTMPVFYILLLNSMIYGAVLFGLRWFCLSHADRLLKRSDSTGADRSDRGK